MTRAPLPVPTHFTGVTDQIFRVPYQERAAQAEAWARTHGLTPASADEFNVALLVIDVQNTFCMPDFELFVGGRSGRGAVDDSRRLCEFIYRNLGVITRIIATLDTHQAMQIFHSIYLVDELGRHPDPFTLVSSRDIASGRWKMNPEVARQLGIEPAAGHLYLEHYTRTLENTGKYNLSIWPYHSMLGGIGHALVPAVEEAVFFHTIARRSQAEFRIKGNNPATEHYSVLGPEVNADLSGREIAGKDPGFVEHLLSYDAIVIAGQAKSHCVAWTVEDLLVAIRKKEPRLADRIYLLEDCASPVVVPGVVDYTEQADAAYRRFAGSGMHVVRSTMCELG